jgi:hypothetical protein
MHVEEYLSDLQKSNKSGAPTLSIDATAEDSASEDRYVEQLVAEDLNESSGSSSDDSDLNGEEVDDDNDNDNDDDEEMDDEESCDGTIRPSQPSRKASEESQAHHSCDEKVVF